LQVLKQFGKQDVALQGVFARDILLEPTSVYFIFTHHLIILVQFQLQKAEPTLQAWEDEERIKLLALSSRQGLDQFPQPRHQLLFFCSRESTPTFTIFLLLIAFKHT
jgi:hypothetical protein